MNSHIIWKNNGYGIDERACINENGDFIGLKTGKLYSKDSHYMSEELTATIKNVDDPGNTGMMHLATNEENERHEFRRSFIGCTLTFRKAHLVGNIQVYMCLEISEYFTQNELIVH